MKALAADQDPTDRALEFKFFFQDQANCLALQFGGPLWLIGSFCYQELYGDIDLRLVVEPEDLDAMFGDGASLYSVNWQPGRYMRAREELKQSRRLSRRWHWYGRFDFQLIDARYWRGEALETRPQLRMDDVPDWMFAAGRGDAS